MIKLLVIDDEASMRRMLKLALTADDTRLEVADDGAGALELAERFAPDVVLLDIELTGTNGFDVCRALRAHALPALARVGIILMSGQFRGSPAEVALVGADHLVAKPFKISAMRALVRELHQEVLRRR